LHRTRNSPTEVQLDYRDGEGVLRNVMAETTARGFSIAHVANSTSRSSAASFRG
jgi:acetolactate synthase regulatory subunit